MTLHCGRQDENLLIDERNPRKLDARSRYSTFPLTTGPLVVQSEWFKVYKRSVLGVNHVLSLFIVFTFMPAPTASVVLVKSEHFCIVCGAVVMIFQVYANEKNRTRGRTVEETMKYALKGLCF